MKLKLTRGGEAAAMDTLARLNERAEKLKLSVRFSEAMTPQQRHKMLVVQAGCALGNRGLHRCESKPGEALRTCIHHVATGSGKRHPYAIVGLCWGGHQGPGGIHGLGVRAFLRLYRPPGETEWGMLAWVNEDIAKVRLG